MILYRITDKLYCGHHHHQFTENAGRDPLRYIYTEPENIIRFNSSRAWLNTKHLSFDLWLWLTSRLKAMWVKTAMFGGWCMLCWYPQCYCSAECWSPEYAAAAVVAASSAPHPAPPPTLHQPPAVCLMMTLVILNTTHRRSVSVSAHRIL